MSIIEILVSIIAILIAAIPVVGAAKKQQGRREGMTEAENERAQEIIKQIQEAKKSNDKIDNANDDDLAASLRKRPNR